MVDEFDAPAEEDLVVYEILIRDFFGEGERNYDNLIDTLSYLKRLGVNAIELMPVMEFNGNESWGYNPTFLFAPDKYYGTSRELKRLVDESHKLGIAVILDIVMNHHDLPNPMVMLDFDFDAFRPEADNKWFNNEARHPFNVFFDMNHESSYTQRYLDTVNHYWLHEYKVDGFRYDLSKGFTQQNHPNDVGAWSAYDASRVALLKRMADNIWSHSPDAYVMLEHFADNTEEKELAEYRADEGKGMLIWGNMNHAYSQNTMGYADNSSLSGVSSTARGWNAKRLVGYMESHDEERLMYRNLTYGNMSGEYSVKNLNTALERMETAGVFFYTIPGPKMIWQFGELGYELSINRCTDGSISNDCRLANKPPRWNYLDIDERHDLYAHTADLLRLRAEYDVFRKGTPVFSGTNTLLKQVSIRNNPFVESPTSTEEMNVHIVGNFDVVPQTFTVTFPHAGTWYRYYKGGVAEQAPSATASITLPAGGYALYTDVPIDNPLVVTSLNKEIPETLAVYPMPVQHRVTIAAKGPVDQLVLYNLHGKRLVPVRIAADQWDLSGIPTGLYVAEVYHENIRSRFKMIKR